MFRQCGLLQQRMQWDHRSLLARQCWVSRGKFERKVYRTRLTIRQCIVSNIETSIARFMFNNWGLKENVTSTRLAEELVDRFTLSSACIGPTGIDYRYGWHLYSWHFVNWHLIAIITCMAERNKPVPMSVLQHKSLVVWTGRALCPLNVTKNKAAFVTDHT